MTTAPETQVRDLPELDAEQEIDVRRYWSRLVSHWWLLAVGLLAGVIIGYLVSIGGGQVYEARALLYLGQPFAPAGGTIQSLQTNPNTIGQIIHSEAAVTQAASRSGIPVSRLRGEISTKSITGGKASAKTGQAPLYEVAVTDRAPRKTAVAALSLAREVLDRTAAYVNIKIHAYETVLASLSTQLKSNQDRVNHLNAALKAAAGLAPLDRLVLVSQVDNAIAERGTLLLEQSQQEQALALAQNVELPKIVEHPVAVKTTARSTRNSMLVGGVIGLLLGIVAALVWEPLMRRLGRSKV